MSNNRRFRCVESSHSLVTVILILFTLVSCESKGDDSEIHVAWAERNCVTVFCKRYCYQVDDMPDHVFTVTVDDLSRVADFSRKKCGNCGKDLSHHWKSRISREAYNRIQEELAWDWIMYW